MNLNAWIQTHRYEKKGYICTYIELGLSVYGHMRWCEWNGLKTKTVLNLHVRQKKKKKK